MNKINIKLPDYIKVFNFESFTIVTSEYKRVIKKNEVHTPAAACIYIVNENKLIKMTLIEPLILSDSDRNISVYSETTFDYASGNKSFLEDGKTEKDMKKRNKSFVQEAKLGISLQEIISSQRYSSRFEAQTLTKKKDPKKFGGVS